MFSDMARSQAGRETAANMFSDMAHSQAGRETAANMFLDMARSQAGRETAANMFSDMAQEAVFVFRSYGTQRTLELSLLSTFHSQVTKQTFTPAVATSTQFAAELTIAIIVQMQPR
jgi:hypothetical protein